MTDLSAWVSSYTGYIDIGTRHLFFYFFESRRDPKTDDVIFWTNGGPGCSSSMGLFMEVGTLMLTDSLCTKPQPSSPIRTMSSNRRKRNLV
jgi:carboxypeptidase C (cathepsin A)